MAEVTAEGRMSTTTTITDGKNGSVPSSMRMGKKSVTEDLVTTFSSPAAWLLVVALIVTWSAVAIVMFDLVDYKAFAGRSVNKLSTEPLRIIHETLEESTDWLYGFISLLSDIIWSDDDDNDEGEVESSVIKEIHKEKTERYEKRTTPKVIHREKPQKQERNERKEHLKVTHKDRSEKQEKPEKRERHAVIHREKSEKHEKKPPSKVIQKHKLERHERTEKKPPPKEEKKVKSTKVETKVKKEVKYGKGEVKMTEKIKQTETKTTEVGLIKAKPKFKEEKALQTFTKSEKKDQYAFCRYVIDMFAHGDFYPGHKEVVSSRLLLEHSPRKKPAAIEERKEEKKVMDVRRTTSETKKKEKEGKKEKAQEKTATPEIKKTDKKEAAVTKELRKPAKAPAASPATKKAVAPEHKKEKTVETAKTAKKDVKAHASVETLKSKTVHEKKEEKATKAAEQDKPKMKHANPGKEKELKYSAAIKDKEHAKEKEGKNPTALKDKESLKGKNPKNPEGSKEKETGKRKDVMAPTVLKEKDSSKGKEMKVPAMTKDKAAVKKQEEKKGTSEKPHEHKHEHIKHEKSISHTKPVVGHSDKKPYSHHLEICQEKRRCSLQGVLQWNQKINSCCTEEKIKQQKTAPTEKSVQAKPAKHEAVRHEKDVPHTKPVKLKTTAKSTGEISITAPKKRKTSKEKEEKTTEKKHLKDEKHKGAPPAKEAPKHHNLTSAPVRYFQCVFINGPNGFGLQFPTNPSSNKEEKNHSKTSKRKTRKPGQ